MPRLNDFSVVADRYVVDEHGCWLWTGTIRKETP